MFKLDIMSSNGSNNRFKILEERIKELKLTEEEQAAFRKAKSQVQSHSRLGALAGLLVGGYVSRIKKFTIGISIAVCIGSITMGSQIGFVTGTAAGIRTIKSLPNSQRIFEAVRDIQSLRRNTPSKKNQGQGGDEDQTSLSDEFIPDNQDFSSNEQQQSSWSKYRSPPTPSQQPSPSSSQQDDDNYSSSWDKIRAKSSPSSTWDKIRQENQNDQNNKTEQQQQTLLNGENIPRTREDFEELYGKGKIRTNQYGDVEIIST